MQYLKTLKIRDKDRYNSLAYDELIILEYGNTLYYIIFIRLYFKLIFQI